MRTAGPALILLCFLLFYSGLQAYGKTVETRKPLRVIIHKIPKNPEDIYRRAEKATTEYSSHIDWSAILNSRFYAGTTNKQNDLSALNIKLNYYGDKNYALEKMAFRDHRLYDGASDIIINPMYILQTGGVGSHGGFSVYGGNWLKMNIKTIDTLAHWTSRRSMSLGIYTASRHFNNNRVLQKSEKIMKDRERRRYNE